MKTTANGISVNYTLDGPASAPVVTLSHSLAADLAMWDPQMKALTAKYRVLRYDTRGHGGTDAPAGAYTLEQLAEDARALLQTLWITKTHWIGLSMGGVYGLFTALKYPGLFASMVLADTSPRLAPEGIQAFKDRVAAVRAGGMEAMVEPTLKRWFKDSFHAKEPALMKRVGEWIRTTPAEGYIGTSAAIPTIDVTARLGEIAIPCLALVGADDVAMPPAFSRILAGKIPDCRYAEIPDAGHISNIEQPEAFNQAVEGFHDGIL